MVCANSRSGLASVRNHQIQSWRKAEILAMRSQAAANGGHEVSLVDDIVSRLDQRVITLEEAVVEVHKVLDLQLDYL